MDVLIVILVVVVLAAAFVFIRAQTNAKGALGHQRVAYVLPALRHAIADDPQARHTGRSALGRLDLPAVPLPGRQIRPRARRGVAQWA
jgi:hypothetical protein